MARGDPPSEHVTGSIRRGLTRPQELSVMNPAIGLLCFSLGFPPGPAAVKVPDWMLPGRCGVNCLFVYLKLLKDMRVSARTVTYDEVAAAVPVDRERGSSLADLSEGAKRLGADVEARKLVVSDFPRLSTPFIAHVDNLDGGGAGHFITVISLDVGGHENGTVVRFIDG